MPPAIGKGTDLQQTLAALDATLDDPVERSTAEQFISAFGHHAGGVHLLKGIAGCAARRHRWLIQPSRSSTLSAPTQSLRRLRLIGPF